MTIELTPAYLASQGLSPSFPKRFWSKVDKNGPIQPHRTELGPCWVWKGTKNKNSQGGIRRGGPSRKYIITSRASWILRSWCAGLLLSCKIGCKLAVMNPAQSEREKAEMRTRRRRFIIWWAIFLGIILLRAIWDLLPIPK